MDKYILRRYLMFTIALFINALGIAIITKALLGTSPITSVTYVLSLFTPMTMGQWTILLNLLFVLVELTMMSRNFLKADLKMYLMQIPITLCFGFFIDLSMSALQALQPVAYFTQMAVLLTGCIVLAAGIALEVKADIAMVAGEYFVRVMVQRFHKEFGFLKLTLDVTLLALACLLSLVFMNGLYGVREGTVVAALCVGPIVHFISPYYRLFDRWINASPAATRPTAPSSRHVVITIAREYGSGGHLLGEMLAKSLNLPLYDKELIHLAAQESGIDEGYIVRNEQAIPSFWLKCILEKSSEHSLHQSLSPDDVLFLAESRIIQDLAGRSSCIIVGRCADFLLKNDPQAIKVFCYSDPTTAARRCVQEYGIAAHQAEAEIKRINRNRMAHYEYYTGCKWGDPHHYDLVLNTGSIDLPTACRLIENLYREKAKSGAATEMPSST